MTKVSIDNSERDKEILSLTAANPKRSNADIGGQFGISRERVRQIRSTADYRQRRRAANEPVAASFRAAFEKFEKIRQRQ
jgi:DNA-directed RNA polymerase sigma subunit (sigma70/sigma32)